MRPAMNVVSILLLGCLSGGALATADETMRFTGRVTAVEADSITVEENWIGP